MKSNPSLKLSLAAVALPLCMTSLTAQAVDQEVDRYTEVFQVNRSVSPLLTNIEGLAEDAFDNALRGDFKKVKIAASKTVASWQAFRNQAKRDGAKDNMIAAMDVSVDAFQGATQQGADKLKTARAANGVSANMEVFFALYNPRTPPVIMTLDYLGREIVVDGLSGDFSSADIHLNLLAARWAALKPNAESRPAGVATVAKYDASIESMRLDIRAQNSHSLVANANVNLELTDAVEKLYGN
jgi:hypothetical protein